MGIEPTHPAWKAGVLPLNYTRGFSCYNQQNWWRGEDSNLRRHSQQIYSLPPLAPRVPLRAKLPLDYIKSPLPAFKLTAQVKVTSALKPRENEAGENALWIPPDCVSRQVTPVNLWSWRWDSNPQPADYKSAALPLSYASEIPGKTLKIEKRQTPPTKSLAETEFKYINH